MESSNEGSLVAGEIQTGCFKATPFDYYCNQTGKPVTYTDAAIKQHICKCWTSQGAGRKKSYRATLMMELKISQEKLILEIQCGKINVNEFLERKSCTAYQCSCCNQRLWSSSSNAKRHAAKNNGTLQIMNNVKMTKNGTLVHPEALRLVQPRGKSSMQSILVRVITLLKL